MFIIRSHHQQAFAQAVREVFEDRMVEHLTSRFPSVCHDLGDERLRERIWDGVERAEKYGITAERDVATFIRYQFSLGERFDDSADTPWAGPILQDASRPPAERLELIRAAALQQRDASRMEQSQQQAVEQVKRVCTCLH